ncbi:hypothetical protein E3Q22_00066 [Wallemia mellicola]|uniref:C2H2-type domain-containing protein n=1 Tax=Wallemia mellicola TaxID=1708541 RepID=A0A4T0MHQ5_9BASI|nr:hypothetical protein E3Q22_00066 [Wallemia mellicola]
MPKAEAGSSKAVANAMKAKGLGRLRWYCQVCEKQCRDENGYKCHTQSESHLRAMLHVGENAGKYISDASQQFQREFFVIEIILRLIINRHGTNRVSVNTVYQEYIADKHHLHMNATRWVTLTEFTKYLGRAGIVRVDETERGLYVSWIDNSPQALARQEAIQKKERQHMDDEQRERKLIAEQIEKAKEQGDASEQKEQKASILDKQNGPIKLSLNTNKTGESSAPKIQLKPTSAAPPKPANVFKSAATSKPKPSIPDTSSQQPSKPKTAMESLMITNEERKRRLAEREQSQTKKVKL